MCERMNERQIVKHYIHAVHLPFTDEKAGPGSAGSQPKSGMFMSMKLSL